MTPMTDLPALREAVAKMTPGPWKADGIDISPIMSTGDFTPCELKRCEDAAGIVALRDAAPALLDEVETLRQRVNEDNEVCLCGCPPDAHECYEEDGESCENETHTCLRVCRSVAAEFEASQKALSAERIEVAHLREAFVTMERAANQHESSASKVNAFWSDPRPPLSYQQRSVMKTNLEAARFCYLEGWHDASMLNDMDFDQAWAAWQARKT